MLGWRTTSRQPAAVRLEGVTVQFRNTLRLGAAATAVAAAMLLSIPGSAHWVGGPAVGVTHKSVVSPVASTRVFAGRAHAAARGAAKHDPTLGHPNCIVATGLPGDAMPVVGDPTGTGTVSMDALDLIQLGMTTDTKKGTVSANLLVSNLHSGPNGTPMIYGEGDYWEVDFLNNGVSTFMSATYPGHIDHNNPSNITVDWNVGHLATDATGTTLVVNDGAGTGALDPANNTITITATLAQLHDNVGATLGTPDATSNFYAGVPTQVNDEIPANPLPNPGLPVDPNSLLISGFFFFVDRGMSNNGDDYVIGHNC